MTALNLLGKQVTNKYINADDVLELLSAVPIHRGRVEPSVAGAWQCFTNVLARDRVRLADSCRRNC